MLRRLCQPVQLALSCLALLAVTSGCFSSHDDAPDDPTRDAGPATGDAAPPVATDAAPAPPVDPVPPPDCGTAPDALRITRACVPGEQGTLPVGRPSTLEVFADGCFCDQELHCRAAVAAPGVLQLETSVCPAHADCRACTPSIRTLCDIPPLTEGSWRVVVNGQPAFDVEARPPEPGLVSERVCFDAAPEVDSTFTCAWPGSWSPVTQEICHPQTAPPRTPVPIRITDTCASCFHQAGACTVSVTGDGTIRVSPTTRSCDCPVCGACPDICVRVELSCHTPPLEPGAYRVESPSGVTTLVVDEASDPTMEICTGSDAGG